MVKLFIQSLYPLYQMRGWNVINSGHVWCPIMFFIIDAKPSVYFCILSENRRILFPKLDLWGDIKIKKKKKKKKDFNKVPHGST